MTSPPDRQARFGNWRRLFRMLDRRRLTSAALPPDADLSDVSDGDLHVAALGVLPDGRLRFRVSTAGSDPRFTIANVPFDMENPEAVAEILVVAHENLVTWSACVVDPDRHGGTAGQPPT